MSTPRRPHLPRSGSAAFLGALLLVACNSTSDAPTAGSAAPSSSAAPAGASASKPAAAPAVLDAKAAELVHAGASCEFKNDSIDLSCPARKAIEEYAFQHQQSKDVSSTCAASLRDTNPSIKLTAAACLGKMTSVAVTPELGAGLDAIDAETSPKIQARIAGGIRGAQAVTAKLDDRVVKMIDKLAATPAGEEAAGDLLDTLFPDYVFGSAPKPPPAAQALVLAALARPKGSLMISALNVVRLMDDKAAVCAALGKGVREDAPEWWRSMAAMSDVGEPCAGEAPHALEVALAVYAKGDITAPQELGRLDHRFVFTAEQRKNAVTALRAALKAAPEWKRKDVSALVTQFSKPRVAEK
jgi:hypothetical protein